MRLVEQTILLTLLLASLLSELNAQQYELSVMVEPGRRECFHQIINPNVPVEVDYQVIKGGEMDISFWVNSPSNRIIITELRKNVGQHNFVTEESGEYRFCFDNSFSRFATKQVFFYVGTNDPNAPQFDDKQAQLARDELGELDVKYENFKNLFLVVQKNIEKAQHMQTVFRAYEIIDRNTMENNYDRINFWSLVNIFILVGVSLLQVYLIRSLFEEKSKIGKVIRSLKVSTD